MRGSRAQPRPVRALHGWDCQGQRSENEDAGVSQRTLGCPREWTCVTFVLKYCICGTSRPLQCSCSPWPWLGHSVPFVSSVLPQLLASLSICTGISRPLLQPGCWERGTGEGNRVAAGLCVNYTSEALPLLQKLLIIIIIIRALGEECAEIREESRKARPELISHFYLRISKRLDIN